jgi:CheY-like chemotaxis protein
VASPTRSVLVVDNDRDIAEVVRAVLTDEGYSVEVVSEVSHGAVAAAVGRVEPDVVLLDGESQNDGYGASWAMAAGLSHRRRRIPVVMFSAHVQDVREAREGSTPRSVDAGFAGIVPKPFELDTLLDIVARAAGTSVAFDRSATADASRTAALAGHLEKSGAQEVRASARREWVTFRTPAGDLMQVYWWNLGGAYLIGRYVDDGRRLEHVATAYERDDAIAICAQMLRGDEREAAS